MAGVAEAHPGLREAIARVLESGQFIMGPDVKLFEQKVAQYLDVKHAIAAILDIAQAHNLKVIEDCAQSFYDLPYSQELNRRVTLGMTT